MIKQNCTTDCCWNLSPFRAPLLKCQSLHICSNVRVDYKKIFPSNYATRYYYFFCTVRNVVFGKVMYIHIHLSVISLLTERNSEGTSAPSAYSVITHPPMQLPPWAGNVFTPCLSVHFARDTPPCPAAFWEVHTPHDQPALSGIHPPSPVHAEIHMATATGDVGTASR